MKFRAIVWPGLRRIGNYEMQLSYGGDPEVLRFFDSRFQVEDVPDFEKVSTFEATEKEWVAFAKAWNDAEPFNPATSIKFH